MNLNRRWITQTIIATSAALGIIATTGCGTSSSSGGVGSNPVISVTPQISGHADGGQGGIAGATVQLYAVGNTGIKSAATPLLTQSVTTGSDGNFNLTGLWNCTNTATYGTDPLLYILVSGGSNASLAMMTAIGPCSTFTAPNTIYINEVTTVAAVYALSPFMADRTHIGTSTALTAGLKNAFATANVLANNIIGASPGTGIATGATIPSSEINSLADSIAPCTNAVSGACTALFTATTPTGGIAPANVIDALLQVTNFPSRNAAALYALGNSTTLFAPKLTAAPSDWTVMLKFTGNGLSSPTGIAIDAVGNAWIANASGSSITGLNPQGSSLTGTVGYSANGSIFGAQAIAVDRTGNIWVADTLLSKVFKLTVSNGAIQSSASFTTGLNAPSAIAVDPSNNIWVTNFGDGTVTELNNNGVAINGSPLNAGGTFQAPSDIAIDSNGRAWVTDNTTSTIAKFDTNGTLLSGTGFTDGALLSPQGIAFDSTGRALVIGNGNGGISIFANDGTSATATPLLNGTLSSPSAIAVDGVNTSWITSSTNFGNLTKLNTGTSPVTNTFANLNSPAGITIDSSGNVWTANSGDDSVSKFVGLASPIVTPLSH